MAASSATDNAPTKWERFIYHFCRIILGLLFIVASYDKILMPWQFGRAIFVYQMLPGYLISPLTIVMPWVELICGLLLVIGWKVRPAAILIALLNLVFIIAIASVLFRGMDIDCGCGLDVGPLAALVGTQADGWALVRDVIIMLMVVATYLGARPTSSKKN